MKNPATKVTKPKIKFSDIFISQIVFWKNREHFVLNIFLNGKILISPRSSDKIYQIHFTELDGIKKYESCEKETKKKDLLKPKAKILRINDK